MLNCVLIACLMKYVKMYNWICRCCVCLGEFEMREELQQIPLCKHVFHPHCISHWLHSNSTCPLCRCSVIPITKHPLSHPLVIPDPIALEDPNFNPDQQMVYPDQGEQVVIVDTNLADYYCSIEEHMAILVEGSSSTSTSRWNNHLFSISKSMCNFFFGCVKKIGLIVYNFANLTFQNLVLISCHLFWKIEVNCFYITVG